MRRIGWLRLRIFEPTVLSLAMSLNSMTIELASEEIFKDVSFSSWIIIHVMKAVQCTFITWVDCISPLQIHYVTIGDKKLCSPATKTICPLQLSNAASEILHTWYPELLARKKINMRILATPGVREKEELARYVVCLKDEVMVMDALLNHLLPWLFVSR